MSHNEWLDIDVLEDYLDGKLDATAMHKVEKLSLEDPFVAQALAGLSESPKRTQSLSLLQKQLKARIEQKPIEKKMWAITSQRLSIGAAAAVLFIAVSVLFWMKGEKRQQMLANQRAKEVEVIVAPQVAIASEDAKVNDDAKVDPVVKVPIDKTTVAKTTELNSVDQKTKAVVANAPIIVANQQADQISAEPVANVASREVKDRSTDLEEVTVGAPQKQSQKRSSAMAMSTVAGDALVSKYYTGKVVSRSNGLPITGAAVKIDGLDDVTLTDKNGEFNILAKNLEAKKVTVAYAGYVTKTIELKTNQKINVLLETSVGVKDALITNLNSNLPVGGLDDYQKYIVANNKFVAKAGSKTEIELSFNIKKDGSISAVKVFKSAGKTFDKEAIRLLKEGPKWVFDLAKSNVGQVRIQF